METEGTNPNPGPKTDQELIDMGIYSQNAASDSVLQQVDDVIIDEEDVFKYVMIKVENRSTGDYKFVVRGSRQHEYHQEILDDAKKKWKEAGLSLASRCVGGGRIRVMPTRPQLLVYGFSQAFGRADHSWTVALIERRYPHMQVRWTNEGY